MVVEKDVLYGFSADVLGHDRIAVAGPESLHRTNKLLRSLGSVFEMDQASPLGSS